MKNFFVLLVMTTALSTAAVAKEHTYDVVVYGGTPGGITAAIAAAREQKSVLLVEPYGFVGGLNTNGLTNLEHVHSLVGTVRGLAQGFAHRITDYYGLHKASWDFEAHVAQSVFEEMLAEQPNIEIRKNTRLTSAKTKNEELESIVLSDDTTVKGHMFIDASYEGDLLAASGATFHLGREGIAECKESLAGIRLQDPVRHASPYNENGSLLWNINPGEDLMEGEAHPLYQAFNYRLNVTNDPKKRVPFPKPENYDPAKYELLKRYLQKNRDMKFYQVTSLIPHNFERGGRHAEFNSSQVTARGHNAVFSIGFWGLQAGYIEGDYETRKRIESEYREATLGVIHFMLTDSSVPAQMRDELLMWGLDSDEFVDNGHWPEQIYVRTGRRLNGEYLFSQHDVMSMRAKKDVISLGSHVMDSHHVQTVSLGPDTFTNEGRIWQWLTGAYDIPYRSIVPKRTEVKNLLAPVPMSSTSVANTTIRLEPNWMMLGEVAGIAASMAINNDKAVQDINVQDLQNKIVEYGGLIPTYEILPAREGLWQYAYLNTDRPKKDKSAASGQLAAFKVKRDPEPGTPPAIRKIDDRDEQTDRPNWRQIDLPVAPYTAYYVRAKVKGAPSHFLFDGKAYEPNVTYFSRLTWADGDTPNNEYAWYKVSSQRPTDQAASILDLSSATPSDKDVELKADVFVVAEQTGLTTMTASDLEGLVRDSEKDQHAPVCAPAPYNGRQS